MRCVTSLSDSSTQILFNTFPPSFISITADIFPTSKVYFPSPHISLLLPIPPHPSDYYILLVSPPFSKDATTQYAAHIPCNTPAETLTWTKIYYGRLPKKTKTNPLLIAMQLRQTPSHTTQMRRGESCYQLLNQSRIQKTDIEHLI